MENEPETTVPAPINPIRVETAISRHPIHRLSRKGSVDIDIREQNDRGETVTRWEVDYSKKHGQPGPLAYKIDTLIINRRIEEADRPIPKVIRLGSLRDICREMGRSEGENVNTIRKALRQNAFAGITAKTRYKEADGTERTLEADFTRYSVVFTGEVLPDGKKADAVYIILNDVYMRVISGAMTRPLDYDYLKSLTPGSQRFYEILSFQMFAAIKNDRPRAKLIYSEVCTYAPQIRHLEWESVRSQLNKIHRPHKQSGYITKFDSEPTADSEGKPDWFLFYTPGPRARAEFRNFNKRGGPSLIEMEPPASESDAIPAPKQLLFELEPSPLVSELIRRGIGKAAAVRLVEQAGCEAVEAKIEVFDWLVEKSDKRVATNPAGYLIKSIDHKDDYPVPRGFVSRAERERVAAQKLATQASENQKRRKELTEDRRYKEAQDFLRKQTPQRQTELKAEALANASQETRDTIEQLRRSGTGDGFSHQICVHHVRRLMDEDALSNAE